MVTALGWSTIVAAALLLTDFTVGLHNVTLRWRPFLRINWVLEGWFGLFFEETMPKILRAIGWLSFFITVVAATRYTIPLELLIIEIGLWTGTAITVVLDIIRRREEDFNI